ncbi:MAG: SlyX protein [Sulfitobacter sp.]|jgi:SlyX protein
MTAVLEEKIAHLEKTVEELSDMVRAQGGEIAVLTRQVSVLLARERERGSEGGGGVILGDERPPHY